MLRANYNVLPEITKAYNRCISFTPLFYGTRSDCTLDDEACRDRARFPINRSASMTKLRDRIVAQSELSIPRVNERKKVQREKKCIALLKKFPSKNM